MDKAVEIRKLPAAALFKICQILDTGNVWEKVMAMIPSDPNDLDSEPKYTLQDIKMIKSASQKQNKSCTEILFDEWGTSGKVRPNLDILLKILVKAQFYRAAEYVAVDLLNDLPPERPLHGPAAAVDLSPIKDEIFTESKDNFDTVYHVPYATLKLMTNNFDNTPVMKCVHENGFIHFMGYKLGAGAFSAVYYGESSSGSKLAVKKLFKTAINPKNMFKNEIETLTKFRHENLISLLGYSCDTDNYCLIYEFMSNGSLLDKLQLKNNSTSFCDLGVPFFLEKPLTWIKRTSIAMDICEGLHYLHTSKSYPAIHRDIKSSNILLDENLRAKVADFGLVKMDPSLYQSAVTTYIFGTSAYMAPEAFRGDVSVKVDVFSFGVILLELLTGLLPFDENRSCYDLVTYIEDFEDDPIEFLLDKKAGDWDKLIAQQIFTLSQACLEEKKSRPSIAEVRQTLEGLWGSIPTAEVTISPL